MKIDSSVKRQCVTKRQSLYIRRKLFRLGHLRVVNEDRDDRNLRLQRIGDLQMHEIVWIIYSRWTASSLAQPTRPNYNYDQIRAPNCLMDVFAEIHPRR